MYASRSGREKWPEYRNRASCSQDAIKVAQIADIYGKIESGALNDRLPNAGSRRFAAICPNESPHLTQRAGKRKAAAGSRLGPPIA
jgi:hypothetical protein